MGYTHQEIADELELNIKKIERMKLGPVGKQAAWTGDEVLVQ
jgi:hypothetical protein